MQTAKTKNFNMSQTENKNNRFLKEKRFVDVFEEIISFTKIFPKF